jgi:hypothetical protein
MNYMHPTCRYVKHDNNPALVPFVPGDCFVYTRQTFTLYNNEESVNFKVVFPTITVRHVNIFIVDGPWMIELDGIRVSAEPGAFGFRYSVLVGSTYTYMNTWVNQNSIKHFNSGASVIKAQLFGIT